MSKKIIIAGAGHAAMMCGATLAKNGYDVTVYERRKRDKVGYPWFDCVNPDIFEMVGAPTPEEAGIEWAWRND
ncbi:MAG: NAD(P)-binding protein, partial [Clostridia bacterium]|nr:NAD(P)-binding protein [Clostridia bacterium]